MGHIYHFMEELFRNREPDHISSLLVFPPEATLVPQNSPPFYEALGARVNV